MAFRNEDLPLAEEIEHVEAMLAVQEAIAVLVHDPHAVLDVLLDAEDPGAASLNVQDRFGLTDIQAAAVLDTQFRRVTRRDRQHLEGSRRELVERLALLRGLDGQSD